MSFVAIKKDKVLHIQKVTGICGSENHLLTLLPRLYRSKYEVTFLILVEPDKPMDDYVELMEKSGVKTMRMVIRRDIDPFLLFRLWRFIRRGIFDIIHTHLIHGDLYGILAAKLARVPFIISSKHGYNEFRYNKLYGFLDRTSARFADKIITISNALKGFLEDSEGLDKKKMITIHYALDENFQTKSDGNEITVRDEYGISPDTPLLGIVGRLITVKGHIYLLNAFKEVLKVIPNAKLLVIGDGELKEELIKTCIYLSISQNVIFTGFRKDVNRIIEEIDLLVLSSLGEGFGLVCLEAMAMGKPIVASNVMAIPEIVVNGETGILTSPKNSHSLAEGIMKLLRDPDLARKMGEKGKKRLEKQFTIEKMTRKTEELYNDMIKEKSGGKKM